MREFSRAGVIKIDCKNLILSHLEEGFLHQMYFLKKNLPKRVSVIRDHGELAYNMALQKDIYLYGDDCPSL
jgi:hypothetical protein